MGKGKDPKPIQLRRPELTNLARGWQEFVIHNLLPTGNKSEITVARAILIHSIIRGDGIRAEEIIADQIILITQGLGGKGKIAFPSTIYKLCKAAKVKINREYGGYEHIDQGRLITNEKLEAQQQGFQMLNDQVASMQIGIQNELGQYKKEIGLLKDKQQELFTNTNNLCNRILKQQDTMNKEMIDLKK
ncbi:hypothetical protein PIB30_099089 [Stylosanthes scabra]|uniref:Putative plant transposon protein domain-containing protein n=1 Tax=Stylosanthes scabra TaxID=79078 RepID=A0ABU6UXX4_9FABA|nr:hypothetical protein [Stylosanthes scabra]